MKQVPASIASSSQDGRLYKDKLYGYPWEGNKDAESEQSKKSRHLSLFGAEIHQSPSIDQEKSTRNA
eukprot:502299-Karenia_brevis.AAC.1